MEEFNTKDITIESSTTYNDKLDYKHKKYNLSCIFCKDKKTIEDIQIYNITFLKQFLNSKGMMNHKNCKKHQRFLRKVIILARHLHLLPYICY